MGDNENNLVNNIDENETQEELASFLHPTCFSPVKLTFIKAVKNRNFATWPGLTAKLIAVHLPKSRVTIFGNLDQTQKNNRSTKS